MEIIPGLFILKTKLEKAVHETIEEQNRLQLLNKLNKKGLCTRDVLSFVSNQVELRSEIKEFDNRTAREAMKSKIRDSRESLRAKHRKKSGIIKQYLEQTGHRHFKIRKIMGDARKKYGKRIEEINKKNEKKIEHLQKQIEKLRNKYENDNSKRNSFKCTRSLKD